MSTPGYSSVDEIERSWAMSNHLALSTAQMGEARRQDISESIWDYSPGAQTPRAPHRPLVDPYRARADRLDEIHAFAADFKQTLPTSDAAAWQLIDIYWEFLFLTQRISEDRARLLGIPALDEVVAHYGS
ncbi:hypothetical protein DFH09DRAFT_1081068 [Mycena vulgaris]|nr:hypothetical protein DFH09DRAFT_1081068 [Mycena vulgaris]